MYERSFFGFGFSRPQVEHSFRIRPGISNTTSPTTCYRQPPYFSSRASFRNFWRLNENLRYRFQMTLSKTRVVTTLFVVIPFCFFYWDVLVEQVGGSKAKALLIVLMAIACGVTDTNNMAGQPELHDHDD